MIKSIFLWALVGVLLCPFDAPANQCEKLGEKKNQSVDKTQEPTLPSIYAESKRFGGIILEMKTAPLLEMEKKQENQVFFELIQATGFYPKVIDKKSVVGKQKVLLAYPIEVAGFGECKLVVEYAFKDNIHVVDNVYIHVVGNSTKIHLAQKGIKKSQSDPLVLFFSEVFETTADKENPDTLVAKSLSEIIGEGALQIAGPSLLRDGRNAAKIVSESFPSLEGLPESFTKVQIHPYLEGPVVQRYRDFMVRFFFDIKNKELDRTQVDFTELESPVALAAFQRKLLYSNIGLWVLDRAKRQFGNAPAAIIIGAFVGYFTAKMVSSNEEEPQTIDIMIDGDGNVVNDGAVCAISNLETERVQGHTTLRFFRVDQCESGTKYITLGHADGKKYQFISRIMSDGSIALIPDNVTLPIFKQSELVFTDQYNVAITFEVMRNGTGSRVVLLPK